MKSVVIGTGVEDMVKKSKKRTIQATYAVESGKFVFVRPTFIQGIARLLDTPGAFRTRRLPLSPAEADYRAIEDDWAHVGNDLRSVARAYDKQARVRLSISREREALGSR